MKLATLFLAALLSSHLSAEVQTSPNGPFELELGFGQSTKLEITLTNTGSTSVEADLFFRESSSRELTEAREFLETNAQDILDLLEGRFQFNEGESGNSINDGGGDMYDRGNFLRLGTAETIIPESGGPFGSSAPHLNYSNSDITTNDTAGVSYFTRKFDGLFVLVADYGANTIFEISGGLGADGSGNIVTSDFDAGSGYRAFVKSVVNAGDPSVNHLILAPADPGLTQGVPNSTDQDMHTISGLPSDGRLIFLLFSKPSGQSFSDATIKEVAKKAASIFRSSPSWLNWDENRMIEPGGNIDFELLLDSTGLAPGTYQSNFAVAAKGSDPALISEGNLKTLSITVGEPTFTPEFNSISVGAILGAPVDPIRIELTPVSGNLDDLVITTDSSWLNVTRVAGENAILVSPESVGASSAEIALTAGGSRQVIEVNFLVTPLNITQLLPDPLRPRLYAINQSGKERGSVLVIDTATQDVIKNIPVGLEPTDLSLTEDSAELLVMNTSDPSIQRIDLSTLEITETYQLAEFSDRNDDVGGHVIDGPDNIIYYIDEQGGPRLRVFDTSSETVLQTFGASSGDENNTSNNDGFGDFAISPDGDSAFGWAQYGDGAGHSNSYVVRFDVSPDGRLSNHATGLSTATDDFRREPFDSPILFSADGSKLVIKGYDIDRESLDAIDSLPDQIYGLTPNGKIMSSSDAFYPIFGIDSLGPVTPETTIQAFLPDYSAFVSFGNDSLNWTSLSETFSDDDLGIAVFPANESTSASPERLGWRPVTGATSFRVYLGTDVSAVVAADFRSPEFLGNTREIEFTLDQLLAPGTYYWKVVPTNASPALVYSFTVSPLRPSETFLDLRTLAGVTDLPGEISLASPTQVLWSATSDQPWLTLLSETGTTADSLRYSIATTNLESGRHQAEISITSDGEGITIPVTLTVDAANFTIAHADIEEPFIYLISEVTPDPTTPAYLARLDIRTDEIVSAVPCGFDTTDFAIHYQENRIYVTNHQNQIVRAFNRSSLTEDQIYQITAPDQFARNAPYKIAAGALGEIMIEGEDQFIDITLIDTADGSFKSNRFERQGGGVFSPDGQFYYHGDSNSSGAVLSRHSVSDANLAEINLVRVDAFSYYGSRRVVRSGDGSRVFWNGGVFDADLQIIRTISPGEVISSSFTGGIAVSNTQIINTTNGTVLADLPRSSSIQAISQDQTKLYLFEGSSFEIVDLAEVTDLSAISLTPSIPDETIVIGPDHELSWSLVPSALGYDVYLGTDATAVANADRDSDLFLGNTTTPFFDGGVSDLEKGITYYWRVDTRGIGQTTQGDSWSFQIAPILVSTPAFQFDIPAGGALPPQTITIGEAGEENDWTASASGPHLSLNKNGGNSGDTLTLTLDTSALANGDYQASITLTARGQSFELPISYTVYALNIVKLHAALDPANIFALSQTPIAEGPSFLIEVSGNSGEIIRFIEAGQNGADFDIAEDLSRLYLINRGETTSTVIDLENWSQAGTLPLGISANGITAAPDGTLIVEHDGGTNEKILFPPNSTTGIGLSQNGGSQYSLGAFSGDNGFYYTSRSYNDLRTFSLENNTMERLETERINTPPPASSIPTLLVSENGERIFVSHNVFDSELNLVTFLPDVVVATNPSGLVAITPDAMHWALSGKEIVSLPFPTRQAAFTSDGRFLIRYNPANSDFWSFAFPTDFPTPQPGQELPHEPDHLRIPTRPGATSYRLFTGASPTNLVFQSSGTQNSFTFDGEVTGFGKTFWRIDAILPTDTVTGQVYDFTIVPKPLHLETDNSVSTVVAREGSLIATSAIFNQTAIYEIPLTDPEMDRLPVAVSYDRVFGEFNNPGLGTHLAKAGDQIFTARNGEVYAIERRGENRWQKGASFQPASAPLRIYDLEGSGDLLFISGNTNNELDGGVLDIYRTFPRPSLEATITPPDNSAPEFGFKIAAHGNLLVVSGRSTSSDLVVPIFIYERDPGTSSWSLSQSIEVPNIRSRPHDLDTDGHRIVILSEDREEGQILSIYQRNSAGSFILEERIMTSEMEFPVFREVFEIALDQNLIGLASPFSTARLDHSGALFILGHDGSSWQEMPALTDPNYEIGNDLDIDDASVFAQSDQGVSRFDLTGPYNRKPRFTSRPSFQAVAGRIYSQVITARDDSGPVTISAEQLPAWLTLETSNGETILTGVPNFDGSENVIRLRATDEAGTSAWQTIDLDLLSPTELPELSGIPEDQDLSAGQSLNLRPVITGTGPFSYQWFLNGDPIPGETRPSLTNDSVSLDEGGTYLLQVTNAVGTVPTPAIEMSVRPSNRFAGDWTTFGNSNRRLGHHPATLGTHRFLPVWNVQAHPNRSLQRTVIAEGKVFVIPQIRFSGPPLVKAYDLAQGTEIWSQSFSEANSMNPPSYHDGRIYFQRGNHSNDSQLWALDAGDGSVVWQAPFAAQWERYEAPAVNHDGIWVNGGRYGGLYGFNLDGSQKFFQRLPQEDEWTPALQNDLAFSWVYGVFTAHDPENGVAIWSLAPTPDVPNPRTSTGVPIVTANEAILRNSDLTLICIDLETREMRWKTPAYDFQTMENDRFGSTPAVFGQTVYAIAQSTSSESEIIALDLETGSEKFAMETDQRLISDQPLIVNDFIIAASENKTYIFNLKTQELVQTLPVGGLLSYSNGYLNVAGIDGELSVYFANDIPDITNLTLPPLIEDTPYESRLEVAHFDINETVTIELLSAPSFVTMNDQGVISGSIDTDPATPSAELQVRLSDGVNDPVIQTVLLPLVATNDLPVFIPTLLEMTEDSPTLSISFANLVTDEETPSPELEMVFTLLDPIEKTPLQDPPVEVTFDGNGLNITPLPDRFGNVILSLQATDQGGATTLHELTINISDVPDRPEIAQIIPAQVTQDDGRDLVLDLAPFFSDRDPYDTELTFTLTENDRPAIFSDLIINGSLMTVRFADYREGTSNLTVTATDLTGLDVSQTFTMTLPDLPVPTVTTTGAIILNRRTGIFEQTITLSNQAVRAIGGFNLAVNGLQNGYRLYNGIENTIPYSTPVAVGGVVTLTLEYHSPTSRSTPTPELTATNILPAEDPAVVAGQVIPDKLHRMEDGAMMLEFETTPGKKYQVQYSNDLITWQNALIPVAATTNRTIWLDRGLPKTNCHPADCRMRAYRIVEISENE